MLVWLDDPARGDFVLESMSFEEVGSIAFRQSPTGWTFGSVFRPGPSTLRFDWAEVESCCRGLIARVEADLGVLGLDPRRGAQSVKHFLVFLSAIVVALFGAPPAAVAAAPTHIMGNQQSTGS